MNLTGLWKGKYTYGKGYPLSTLGKSESFEFDILDNNGSISGTCVDEIVKSRIGNESRIEGSFKDKYLIFLKKYKYPSYITDESTKDINLDNVQSDGILYTGKLYKKLFTRKAYFSGKWKTKTIFKDNLNKTHVSTAEGFWIMEQLK